MLQLIMAGAAGASAIFFGARSQGGAYAAVQCAQIESCSALRILETRSRLSKLLVLLCRGGKSHYRNRKRGNCRGRPKSHVSNPSFAPVIGSVRLQPSIVGGLVPARPVKISRIQAHPVG